MTLLRKIIIIVAVLACCVGWRAGLSAQATPPTTSAEYAWTAQPATVIRTLAGPITVPRLFTRLEVVGIDSIGIVVRCSACGEPGIGVVDSSQVVVSPRSPDEAAGGELAEFLLALRDAVERRDINALHSVMSPEFTFSLLMAGGRLPAFRAWEYEAHRSLDRLPELLDRGVVSRDGRLWVAPPEYLDDPAYRDLRVGFRRENDRWTWVFLVKEES